MVDVFESFVVLISCGVVGLYLFVLGRGVCSGLLCLGLIGSILVVWWFLVGCVWWVLVC